MAEQLTPEHFLPYIKKIFHVPGWPYALTLETVDIRRTEEWEKQKLPRQPFTLIFSGPPQPVLGEGFHALQIADGPSFDLYVIPIHTVSRDWQNYQAAFN